MTCGTKQVCFSREKEGCDNVNADTTFRIFKRVMHLDPAAHPTIICPRSSISDKLDVLIQECKACEGHGNVGCPHTNYSDVPKSHFRLMHESSWSGYQRANLLDCDDLQARLDSEQCAWDDSWYLIFPYILKRVG